MPTTVGFTLSVRNDLRKPENLFLVNSVPLVSPAKAPISKVLAADIDLS
jgi:hypothetical protein